MSGFVHLHLHSEYSLLDGACKIKDIAKKASELGQSAVALTDHGVMYGIVDFYNEAQKYGVKPILGCEVYVARRTRHDRVHKTDSSPWHLVLLCENNKGYHNLMKLVSEAFITGFYSKPRVDEELLRKYHEGIICLSGCIFGEVSWNLNEGSYESAKKSALKYADIFGKNNFFIEVQNHGIISQKRIIPLLIQLSNETDIPLVATNDVHYINQSDAEIQKILLCMQTGCTISEPPKMIFETKEFYMKSKDEMFALFKNIPEAISNTSLIADRCNAKPEFTRTRLPKFEIKGCIDNLYFFEKLCFQGIYRKYGENPDKYIIERVKYEIDTINKMGYVDYFLIVSDFIKYARDNGIPVGPGRGSGAGSICAYCLDITLIDPIKYNLIFERFLNPERISMPDFDIDFCVDRRAEVIDYVVKKYGEDRVAQIITFDTMLAKSAVRDTGKVMGISSDICDKIIRLIPSELNITIEAALNREEELKRLYISDNTAHKLIDIALKIEGMPRNYSVHAAGVVISDAPLNNFVPLRNGKEYIMTQYPMNILESLGVLKIDFLGVRNLTIIKYCTDLINVQGKHFDINAIPVDDAKVFNMISEGKTTGIFQFESRGMRSLVTRLLPESLEDLAAALALYRPGPMDSIPTYINNKKHPEDIKYIHPLLENILDVTYGCIVYQEQVMEICRTMAGYSYGRADIVRRAMSKKKQDIMELERQNFIYGTKAKGIPLEIAEKIFDKLSGFAAYAFNKSHAAAYAYLAYQTAYLRCHYFKEYMAAILTNCLASSGKFTDYLSECELNGVKLIKPSINESQVNFTVVSDGIRFGLSAIRNIGKAIVEEIIYERDENGPYKSLHDFAVRTKKSGVSRKMTESLIKSGAFDGLGLNRRQMLENADKLLLVDDRCIIEGQLDLFGEMTGNYEINIPYISEYDETLLFAMEKEVTGMYMSGHPLSQYVMYSKLLRISSSSDIIETKSGLEVSFLGMISSVKEYVTKKGDKMCFMSVEDMSGVVDFVVFSNEYVSLKKNISEGSIVYIKGKLSEREGRKSISVSFIFSEDEFKNIIQRKKLCINITSDKLREVSSQIKSLKSGDTQICFFLSDKRKIVSPKDTIKISLNSDLYYKLSKKFSENNIALI